MSYCKNCRTQIGASDSFCSTCGASQNNEDRKPAGDRQRGAPFEVQSRKAMLPAMHTPDGKARFKVVEDRYGRRRIISFSTASIFAILGFGGLLISMPGLAAVGGAVSLTSLAVAYYAKWDEVDYYTVPGSKDINGEHRCIWCGHRGIYRHGEYKTNNEHAACSKCKTSLWTN